MAFLGVLNREITVSRRVVAVLGVLAVGLAVVAWLWSDPTDEIKKELEAKKIDVQFHKPIAVGLNRGADVLDGFRGGVHPLLHGQTRLDVTAHWTALDRSRLNIPAATDEVYAWYTGLRPAVLKTTYTEVDFSAFLPETVNDVGQLWAVNPNQVLVFLRQFHANASMHLVATGRRAGPDGAFAILRAVSPTHLEIAFRVHTEFLVTPEVVAGEPTVFAWYTPAYFSGRMVINKKTGTVEHFRLALPTEKALNVFLTVNPSLTGVPNLGHEIVRVERMELTGGDGQHSKDFGWTKSLSADEADRRLARVFYKFEEIDWVPPDQVVERARSKKRPIFAIVSWGATDDQSC